MFENYKDCFSNDKIILKSQESFKSYNHDVYTEEINKIALSSHDDERLQTSDRIKTNAFTVCGNEMLIVKRFIPWTITIKINVKINNFDNYANENKTKHNKNWPYIPYHPYRILIIGGSGSRETNLLLNLIENQADIDKIYLYTKDPYELEYQ